MTDLSYGRYTALKEAGQEKRDFQTWLHEENHSAGPAPVVPPPPAVVTEHVLPKERPSVDVRYIVKHLWLISVGIPVVVGIAIALILAK
jgi:hypothetical protein